MTLQTLHLLMLMACLGLAGLGFSAWMLMNHQAKLERVRQRTKAVTEPHLNKPKVEAPKPVRMRIGERPNTPFGRVAAIFGYNAERPDQYSMKWYVVFCLVAIVARLVAGTLAAIIGPIMWISLPVVLVVGCRTVFNMMLGRRRAKLYSQFSDCLAMIVRSVRAGVPLTEAIRIVAKEIVDPSATEFGRVAGDLAIGVSIADALKSLAERNDITEFRFFATALILQSQTGGRLGETLDNLGAIVRKRMAMKQRGHALASEAKMTALILGGLPGVAAGFLYLLNPDYVMVLFIDPTGRLILMAALCSLGIGAFIMKATINKSLS